MRLSLFVPFILLNIYSCSPAATDPTKADEVKASINIQFYNARSMSIDAVLVNGKGKAIAADSTTLYVNDSAMYYFVKQDLYYGKHPGFSYGTENYKAKDSILHFRIKFHNDSSIHEIGSINLAGITNLFQLKDTILKEHQKQQTLLLPVKKANADSVVIYLSYTYKNSDGNLTYAGGPYDSLARQIAILKDTEIQIPATYFQQANVTVEELGYEWIQYRVGKVHPAFATSTIQANATIKGIIPLR